MNATATATAITATVQDPTATIGRIRVDANHHYSFVVGTTTAGKPLTTGCRKFNTLRTVDEIRDYATDVKYSEGFMPHFVRIGADWFGQCGRCGGSGDYGFGPDNGACFDCRGVGRVGTYTEAEMVAKTRQWADAQAWHSAKEQKRIDKFLADRAKWFAANAELVAWVKSLTPDEVTQDPTYWDSSVMADTEHFNITFGARAGRMIRTVREGIDLEWDETKYLTATWQNTVNAPEVEPGRYVGTVGKPGASCTGTVTARRDVGEDVRGNTKFLIEVTGTGDDAGIVMKTFTTASWRWEIRVGDEVRMTGSVTKHSTYRGKCETTVKMPRLTVIKKKDGDDE